METLNYAELKLSLLQTILMLDETEKLLEIQQFIANLIQLPAKEIDEKPIESFEEWNMQFDDSQDSEIYIEEYGMNLHEYRLQIYNAEQEEGISKEEFMTKLNNLE